MADDHGGSRGYPRRDSSDGSSYPPPPEDENDRRSQYPLPPAPSGSVSLPSMPYPSQGPAYALDVRYTDPRYSEHRPWGTEPTANPNGYPPPPPDPRHQSSAPPPPNDRRPYDDRSRSYDGDRRMYEERRQYEDRRQYFESYFPGQVDPPRSAPYGYTYPQPPHGYGYPPPTQAPPQPQAAPRQRTSIACRYCRKRKIRCSGYANTSNGKCTNCDKLRIECVFQPVSSNSSTAFVPVSAVPGGVPPGTPLYGAYGQPLPPAPAAQPSSATQPYPPPPSDYPPPPAHSPTSQYPPPPPFDDRDPGRRRTRPADEEHGLRLPPPNFPDDNDPRRRSPASNHSNHSNGTPPSAYHQYPQTGYDQTQMEAGHRTSPSGPSPSGLGNQPPSLSNSNVMSLDHLIASDNRERASGHDIDRSMLGKLNRRS